MNAFSKYSTYRWGGVRHVSHIWWSIRHVICYHLQTCNIRDTKNYTHEFWSHKVKKNLVSYSKKCFKAQWKKFRVERTSSILNVRSTSNFFHCVHVIDYRKWGSYRPNTTPLFSPNGISATQVDVKWRNSFLSRFVTWLGPPATFSEVTLRPVRRKPQKQSLFERWERSCVESKSSWAPHAFRVKFVTKFVTKYFQLFWEMLIMLPIFLKGLLTF